jgi:FixJ family two-component response regulator
MIGMAMTASTQLRPFPLERMPSPAPAPQIATSACTAPSGGELVHVVDLDPGMRELLPAIFKSVGWSTRVYGDLCAFLQASSRDVAGCLILDARLALRRDRDSRGGLTESGAGLPVVITAAEADVAMAVGAMKAGAFDFLEKPCSEQQLLDAVAAALEADRRRRAEAEYRDDLRGRFQLLSRREREVMMLVTAGKMNKQIAWELGLSEITVKVHRGSAMRKMGARNLAGLVRMADAIGVGGKKD